MLRFSRERSFAPVLKNTSIRNRGISEPSAVAQLEDPVVELGFVDLGQDPFQARENGAAVGFPFEALGLVDGGQGDLVVISDR